MPRKSVASLSVVPVLPTRTRLRPGRGLPRDVKEAFESIVNAAAVEMFSEIDRTLLTEIAHTLARVNRAEKMLALQGEVLPDGRLNPWFRILTDSRAALLRMLTRARLVTSARLQPKQIRPKVAPSLAIDWGLEDA
jgi:hypothetical protein